MEGASVDSETQKHIEKQSQTKLERLGMYTWVITYEEAQGSVGPGVTFGGRKGGAVISMGAPGGASGEAAKILTWAVGSRVGLPYHDSLRSNLFREIFGICILGYNEKSEPKSDPVIHSFPQHPVLLPLLPEESPLSMAGHLSHTCPRGLHSSHAASSSPATCYPLCPDATPCSLWLAPPLLQAFLDVTFLAMFSSSIWYNVCPSSMSHPLPCSVFLVAYFASRRSHLYLLTCLGFGLVPLLGTVGIFVGWTPSAYNGAWHMAANSCHVNEPEGEVAPGVLSPAAWFWPRALPGRHSQDTGAQRWQLSLQSGPG